MKVALGNYLSGSAIKLDYLHEQVNKLSSFDLNSLSDDNSKKAFWINLYNGLTNYFIIKNQVRKSVWEVENFFSALTINIEGEHFSLDDIEHGILRKNGERKKGKPLQFREGELKRKWMVDQVDPRIHFALNCGSISCPPIAFYSTENIDEELSLAEESFTGQEFMINHQNQSIRCSEIFVWYRNDFSGSYLNAPGLADYHMESIPYQWTVH